MPRRFHPARVFAQPRSLYGLVNVQPRVISDDSWAKLLWAASENRSSYSICIARAPLGRAT